MYICICNAIRDKEIAANSGGARSVADVFKRCGSRPQCGKCLPDVAQMIQDARDIEAGPTKIAAE